MTVVVLRLLPPCVEHEGEPSAWDVDQAPERRTRIARRLRPGQGGQWPGRGADDSDRGRAPSPRPSAQRREAVGVWPGDVGELLRGNLDDLDLAALDHVPGLPRPTLPALSRPPGPCAA